MRRTWIAFAAALMVCLATGASAQDAASGDTRTQYPAFLNNSYVSLNVGWIGYLLSARQLEPGFQAESVDKARLGVRAEFLGHRFNKHLSAQVVYLRPGWFVRYNNVNGTGGRRLVSNAYGGLTFALDTPLTSRVSIYGEGCYGVTSRSGFEVNGKTALRTAHYAAGLVGGGLTYRTTPNTDVVFAATYSPGRQSFDQPSMRMYTTGLRYHLRPVPAADVVTNRDGGDLFPANVVRAGVTTDALKYGVNDLFSRWVVIFWGGHVQTKQGGTIEYERNVFHTKKRIAFDLGLSASSWQSKERDEKFRTFSVYPLMRYFFARLDAADVYFSYSLAGPTFISQPVIDGQDTGARFTFQDAMGVGAFLGKSPRLNIAVGIKHFSNGNLATHNAGVMIPLTFSVGVTF